MKPLFTLLLAILVGGALLGQGVTRSGFEGSIKDQNGEPLIGANVVAVHVESGSTYGNATDLDGFYRIPNVRVGGPYRITVTYTGFEEYVQNDVYVSLGQTYKLDAVLSTSATILDEVTIVSSSADVFDGNKTGQESVLDERLINDIPTVSRAIGDYARFNPWANVTENDDGFTISLAGQNNRYNAIYIDGAVNNDAFGLAGSGTNGGQTGVQPISIDAIEQFTVAVAPYDVRQSGFAGGSINAVTRSGTNQFEGSAYYFWRNENLAGKTPTDDPEVERRRLAPFTARTYGFRLGGPIIKDKLFFFVNAELQRDETPQPFDFENYQGNASRQDIDALIGQVQEAYDYDIGSFDDNTASLESDKILAKLDWNINQNHKLSLRHSYVGAENLEARNSSPNDLEFINGSEFFVSNTNSSALELNSIINNSMSNNLKVGLTIVRDDRDPFGDPFPTVELQDGDNGDITFGAERFSTANRLDQDIFTITNDFSLYKGKHEFTFGANFEYFRAANLFIRNNFGRYRYFDNDDTGMTGLQQWLAGMPAGRFERSFSLVDDVAGDESEAIAEFAQMLIGVYVQDAIRLTDDFQLTAGLRIDVPIWPDDQPVNEQFNTQTIPAIESFGYDLRGARTGQFIGSSVVFSPRVGFNWDVTGDKRTQLRGGAGIFTSRIPLVWPGGAYNNYGLNIGEVTAEDVEFEPDVQNQPFKPDLENPTPSGQIDLFADDFKIPQVLKASIGVDHKLTDRVVVSLEGLYTKNINNVRYENLNLKPNDAPEGRGTLQGSPDNRPVFLGTQPGFGDDVIDDNYTFIMLASNTNEGHSYNVVASVQTQFTRNFVGTVSYSYGDSYTLFDGTSSQNNSQWRGFHNVMGRNFSRDAQRSDFAQGHRIFGQLSYQVEYLKFLRSTLSLNFNAQTGGYYSYVIGARNFLFIDDGGFDNNELYYVPNNADEALLVETEVDGEVFTPAEQWEILNQFIEDDPHLSDRRGDYAERNGGRLPMQFDIDLRFLQDVKLESASGREHVLQFSVDIFNFTNLLNQDWGRKRFAGSFGNYSIVNLQNVTLGENPTPEYSVNPQILRGEDPWTGNIDDSGFRSSRWQMQLGVRYIFQ